MELGSDDNVVCLDAWHPVVIEGVMREFDVLTIAQSVSVSVE